MTSPSTTRPEPGTMIDHTLLSPEATAQDVVEGS